MFLQCLVGNQWCLNQVWFNYSMRAALSPVRFYQGLRVFMNRAEFKQGMRAFFVKGWMNLSLTWTGWQNLKRVTMMDQIPPQRLSHLSPSRNPNPENRDLDIGSKPSCADLISPLFADPEPIILDLPQSSLSLEKLLTHLLKHPPPNLLRNPLNPFHKKLESLRTRQGLPNRAPTG